MSQMPRSSAIRKIPACWWSYAGRLSSGGLMNWRTCLKTSRPGWAGRPRLCLVKKPRTKKDKSPKTNRTVLRKLIIEGLIQLGGSAQKKDLYKRMEKNYEGTSNRDCPA